MYQLMIILGGLSAALAFIGLAGLLRSVLPGSTSESGYEGPAKNSLVSTVLQSMADLNRRESMQSLAKAIDKKLLYAGRPFGGIDALGYLGAIELAACGGFVVVLAMFLVAGNVGLAALLVPGVIACFIFWLGLEWLNNLVSDRRKAISRTFPYFLDLGVMTMEAGATFLETIETYIRDNPSGALGDELKIILGEIQMGKTFEEAIVNFMERITAEEVQNTLRAMLQGQKMGTSMGEVLRNEAEAIRFKRSQLAERTAEEIKVRLQGPAMLLMMSVLLLILGPALIGMFGSGVF